jgi:hypothetical protein
LRADDFTAGRRHPAQFAMSNSDSSRTPQRVLLYVTAYLFWLLSIVACALAALQLSSTANVLVGLLSGNRYAARLANQASLLVVGLAAFAYAMFLEGYYREGARSGGGLLRRFAITVAVPLGVFVVSLALSEIAVRLID